MTVHLLWGQAPPTPVSPRSQHQLLLLCFCTQAPEARGRGRGLA